MFSVEDNVITISRGDTGAVTIQASVIRRDTGNEYAFSENDRALFTVKSMAGSVVKRRAYQMTNNSFTVVFYNQDTEEMENGNYQWDVRYIINPYYDEDVPGGPWTPYSDLEFPVAAGTPCEYNHEFYYATQNIATQEAWTAAHWAEAWPDYSDLEFPVAAGTKCTHGGTYYSAKQTISTSETWTASHWALEDFRLPVDGDQVITPTYPMEMRMISVVGDV